MVNDRDIKKANIDPIASGILVSPNNEYTFQYRIISDDLNKTSEWSNIYTLNAATVTATNVTIFNTSGATAGSSQITWGDENDRPLYDIYVHQYQTIDFASALWSSPTNTAKKSKTLNVVTISNLQKPHNLQNNMTITTASIGTGYNDTNAVVTVLSDTSFSYISATSGTLAQSNVITGSVTIGTLTSNTVPTYTYHGTSPIHSYSVLDSFTNQGYSYTSNYIWVRIQVASYDKVLSDKILIGTESAIT